MYRGVKFVSSVISSVGIMVSMGIIGSPFTRRLICLCNSSICVWKSSVEFVLPSSVLVEEDGPWGSVFNFSCIMVSTYPLVARVPDESVFCVAASEWIFPATFSCALLIGSVPIPTRLSFT